MEVIKETLWKRCLSTKPPAKNSNICLSKTANQHKGTRKKCKKTNQAAIIQWQWQCLMYKPHRKPWPKSKISDISKQSPSPLHHTFLLGRARFTAQPLGTLSKDDDDGSEFVVKKMNLRSFKPNRVCLDPLNMPNTGDFSWSWILKGFYSGSKRGRKIRRRMSTSSIKRQIRRLHDVVVQWTSKKCTKKRDARAQLLFWSLNLLFFSKSSLWSSS